MSKPWDQAAASFRSELRDTVSPTVLRRLHRIQPWRHAAVLLRQVLVLGLAVYFVLRFGDRWYAWLPASIVIGFVVFSFTVLLHEVVHGTVFRAQRPRANRLLGLLYALPSGLAQSQFTRWHLDHHDNLGTVDGDPKRHYLTPRIVARWFKALYFTPALFPIYFRAARQATSGYVPALQRRIRLERLAATLFHLGVLAGLGFGLGWHAAIALHVIPVFVVFPVAFALNRLGQHYDIDPRDPAKWGTLIRPSPFFWDRIFLWSNYHLEHHYFPKVPFYNLPALHRALAPFFAERDWPARTYGHLLYEWLIRNRTPHTLWNGASAGTGPARLRAAGVADETPSEQA